MNVSFCLATEPAFQDLLSWSPLVFLCGSFCMTPVEGQCDEWLHPQWILSMISCCLFPGTLQHLLLLTAILRYYLSHFNHMFLPQFCFCTTPYSSRIFLAKSILHFSVSVISLLQYSFTALLPNPDPGLMPLSFLCFCPSPFLDFPRMRALQIQSYYPSGFCSLLWLFHALSLLFPPLSTSVLCVCRPSVRSFVSLLQTCFYHPLPSWPLSSPLHASSLNK